jgi:hypothetical protein
MRRAGRSDQPFQSIDDRDQCPPAISQGNRLSLSIQHPGLFTSSPCQPVSAALFDGITAVQHGPAVPAVSAAAMPIAIARLKEARRVEVVIGCPPDRTFRGGQVSRRRSPVWMAAASLAGRGGRLREVVHATPK